MQTSMNTNTWTKGLCGRLTLKRAMQSLLLTFLSWFAGPTPCAANMQNGSFVAIVGLPVTQSQRPSGIHAQESAGPEDRGNPQQHGKIYERCFTRMILSRIGESPERRKW